MDSIEKLLMILWQITTGLQRCYETFSFGFLFWSYSVFWLFHKLRIKLIAVFSLISKTIKVALWTILKTVMKMNYREVFWGIFFICFGSLLSTTGNFCKTFALFSMTVCKTFALFSMTVYTIKSSFKYRTK